MSTGVLDRRHLFTLSLQKKTSNRRVINRLKAILHHLQRLPFEIFILIVVLAVAVLSTLLIKLFS